ncbi:MAG: hypothetical protein AAGC60_26230 [Acidobacteriota bacterium]
MSRSSPKAPRRLIRAEHLEALYLRGLERCRKGQWQEGLVDLSHVASQQGRDAPSLCYSYLGYGIARYRRQVAKGLRLCRYAVKQEFYQPENYVNLARVCLLSDENRRMAWEAVRDGLKIDPEHHELLELQQRIGYRRPPVLPFMSRRNPLNRLLGWMRHRVASGGAGRTEEGSEPRSRAGAALAA